MHSLNNLYFDKNILEVYNNGDYRVLLWVTWCSLGTLPRPNGQIMDNRGLVGSFSHLSYRVKLLSYCYYFYFLYLDGSFKTLVTVYSLGIYVKYIKREITFGVQ